MLSTIMCGSLHLPMRAHAGQCHQFCIRTTTATDSVHQCPERKWIGVRAFLSPCRSLKESCQVINAAAWLLK